MIKYNKEELNTIKSAYNKILDDMDLLWEKSEIEEIELRIYFGKTPNNGLPHDLGKIAYLVFNDQEIRMEYRNFRLSQIINIEKRNRRGKPSRNYDVSTMEALLEKYSEIREILKGKIEESISDKKRKIDLFKSIDEQYSKEANIELSLPETLNQHKLEVVEEDGKKVGTLNFGSISLKIITSGNVELVSKPEVNKVKAKRKEG